MKVHVQIIGINTGDAAPSLMVVTDTVRYLFNVGEGLQRFCSEHRNRIVRTDTIFLTGTVNTLNIGGLPGLLLTIADMGKKTMHIYGNYGIHAYMAALRNFMRRDDVSLYCGELTLPSSVRSSVRSSVQGSHEGSNHGPMAIRLPSIHRPELTVTPIMLVSTKLYTSSPLSSTSTVSLPYENETKEGIHTYVRNNLQSYVHHSRTHSLNSSAHKPSILSSSSSSGKSSRSPSPTSRASVPSSTVQYTLPFNPLTLESLSTPASATLTTESSSSLHTILNNTSTPIDPALSALCYVCTTDPIIGKFYPEKAKALGVPLGPLFGRLKNGQSVEINEKVLNDPSLNKEIKKKVGNPPEPTSASSSSSSTGMPSDTNGSLVPSLSTKRIIIEPSQVKDPDQPGQMFAIIACPSCDFLPSLQNSHDAFASFLPSSSSPNSTVSTIKVMYHMTPSAIATTPEYISWLNSLDDSIQHIMLDPVTKSVPVSTLATSVPFSSSSSFSLHQTILPTMFYSQAWQQCKLHILRPSSFALPVPVNETAHTMYQQLLEKHTEFRTHELLNKQLSHNTLSPLQRILQYILTVGPSSSSTLKNSDDPMDESRNPLFASIVSTITPPSTIDTVQLGQRTVRNGWPLQQYTILPIATQGIDNTNSLPILQPLEALEEMIQDPLMLPHIEQAFIKKNHGTDNENNHSTSTSSSLITSSSMPNDVEIIFTGTSSALPNKYRNVSGIYLYMPSPAGVSADDRTSRSGIFLDCGEGSYGGLVRRFGRAVHSLPKDLSADSSSIAHIDEAMSNLKILWISHMHADHHLGALRLIYERNQVRQRLNLPSVPLLVIGPTRMYTWLMEYTNIDRSLLQQWCFVDAEHFLTIPSIIDPSEHGIDSGDEGGENNTNNNNGNTTKNNTVSLLRSDLSGEYPNKVTPNQFLIGKFNDNNNTNGHVYQPQLRKKPRMNDEESAVATLPDADTSSLTSSAMEIDGAVCNVPENDKVLMDPTTNVLLREPPRQSRRPARSIIAIPSPTKTEDTLTNESTLSSSEPVASSSSTSVTTIVVNHLANETFINTIFQELGIASLRVVRVRHCTKAYGIRLDMYSRQESTHHRIWSLVYSGDTRPCSELIALGQGMVDPLVQLPFAGPTPLIRWYTKNSKSKHTTNSNTVSSLSSNATDPSSLIHACLHQSTNLLIHEATFEDTDEGKINALLKRHTTAGEAVTVGQRMKADFTLLTHFSARYPKLPVIKLPDNTTTSSYNTDTVPSSASSSSTTELSSGLNVFVAYDLMNIRGNHDLYALPSILPAMHDLFAEEAKKEEDDNEEEA